MHIDWHWRDRHLQRLARLERIVHGAGPTRPAPGGRSVLSPGTAAVAVSVLVGPVRSHVISLMGHGFSGGQNLHAILGLRTSTGAALDDPGRPEKL
jgi:hypothetical protein